MELVHKSLASIFNQQPSSEKIGIVDKAIEFLVHLQIVLQNIRLLWHPSMSIKDWDNHKGYWEIFSLTSPDCASSFLGILQLWLYGSIGIIIMISSFLILSIVLTYANKQIPCPILKLLRILFFLQSYLYFIPITIILLLFFKYSSGSYAYISEYLTIADASELNYGLTGKIFSVVLLSMHLCLGIIYEACSFEISHFRSDFCLASKSNPKIDAQIKIVAFGMCALYVNIIQTNYVTYIFILIALYVFLIVNLFNTLPNYNLFMNFLKILVKIEGLFVCFLFLVSQAMDNANIVLLLSILLQPAIFMLTISSIKFRISLLKKFPNTKSKNFYVFELLIRDSIKSGELGLELLEIMNENLSYSKNKCNLIIQAYYCIEILDDSMLGLIKISRTDYKDVDLFTSYQVFRCKELLQKINSHVSGSYNFYKYLIRFSKCKDDEKILCFELLKLNDIVLNKKTKLQKLKKSVNGCKKQIRCVVKQYNELVKTMPNSKILLQMYGSFLADIIGDPDTGKYYLDRSNGLESRETKQNNNMSIEERTGFLIISGNKATLGKIIYANDELIRFLGHTKESINSFCLQQLIPKPYDKNHNLKLLKFVETSKSNTIFPSIPLFLSNHYGFLLECYLSVECIGHESETNFFSTVEPIINTKREVALIDKTGELLGHSKGVPQIFGTNQVKIEGRLIIEFLPDVTFDSLVLDQVYTTKIFNKLLKSYTEIAFVLKERFVAITSLYALYMTINELEILEWKKNGFSFEESTFIERKISDIITTTDQKIVKSKNIDKSGSSVLDLENIFEDKKPLNPSTSSSKVNAKEAKDLKTSLRALSSMQVLTLIVCNIIILFYISEEVRNENSMNILSQLGNLTYSISQIVLITRSIDISEKSTRSSLFTVHDLMLQINQTEKLQATLLSNYNSWSFCEYSDIVNNNIVPYWAYSTSKTASFGSLYQIITLFLENAREFVSKYQSGSTNYQENLFFIVFNGMGQPYIETKKALQGICDCETNKVDELNALAIYLTIGAMLIFGILFLFLSIYALSINKELNSLWEHLRKKIHRSYYEFKKRINDRLQLYHDDKYISHDTDPGLYANSVQTKNLHSLNYIKRFGVLFAIAGAFYSVSHFIFYSKVSSYLYYRPILMHTLIARRILLDELYFYTIEYEIQNTNYSFTIQYPEINILNPPIKGYSSCLNSLIQTKKLIRDPQIVKLMSSDVYEIIFESISNVSSFMNYGTYNAISYLCIESQKIVYDNQSDSSAVLSNYIEQTNQIAVILNLLAGLTDNCSQYYINIQLNNYIYFVFAFCFFIILSYFLYYSPYLKSEKKSLKRLQKVISIIPMELNLGSLNFSSKNIRRIK